MQRLIKIERKERYPVLERHQNDKFSLIIGRYRHHCGKSNQIRYSTDANDPADVNFLDLKFIFC